MTISKLACAHRSFLLTFAAAFCLSLAACGGSSDDANADPETAQADEASKSHALAVAQTNTLQTSVIIPGFPHKVDVYRPAGATKAIVFLHGHGGRNWQIAYDLGFNRVMAPVVAKNVNWDWLASNGIIAVFPQGQAIAGSLPTWSNYVFNSGQDDVAFLKALSSFVKTQYGASEVSLSGHSSGGVMTARMWCEATTSFKGYVSIAGPMVSPNYPGLGTTCTPLAPAPYYMLVGNKDTKLINFTIGVVSPTPEQMAAGLTDTILVSEWMRHSDRSKRNCSETPALQSAAVAASGPTWNSCDSRVRYSVVANADHPIASLEQNAGMRMADIVAGFVK